MEVDNGELLCFKHKSNHDSKVKSYSEHNVNEDVTFMYGRRGTHQADEHTTRQMSVLTPTHESINQKS